MDSLIQWSQPVEGTEGHKPRILSHSTAFLIRVRGAHGLGDPRVRVTIGVRLGLGLGIRVEDGVMDRRCG